MRLPVLLAAVLATGCTTGTTAGRGGSRSTATTEFYYGTMTTSSADGKIPMGPPTMTLVRREVVPADDRITETVLQNGVTRVTTLERQEGARFAAVADDRSFSGALDFSGEEWNWRSWRYSFALADGSGVIQGTGRIDGKWLETERYFIASNGERRTRIVDRLVKITSEEYERRRAEMIAATPKSTQKRR